MRAVRHVQRTGLRWARLYRRLHVTARTCGGATVSEKATASNDVPDHRPFHKASCVVSAGAVVALCASSVTTAFALAPFPGHTENHDGVRNLGRTKPEETAPTSNQHAGPIPQLGRFAVADAVERVGPSVVKIRKTTRRANVPPPQNIAFGSLPLPFSNPSIDFDDTHVSGGSGFIVGKEGERYFILTNSHVVQDPQCPGCDLCNSPDFVEEPVETTLEVTLASGETFIADLSAADPTSDLAVLTIDSETDLPIAELGDSERARPGEFVVAVGSPLQVLSNSCSFGIISSVHRDLEPATGVPSGGMTFLQIDCAINPGSSGGPVVDLDGKVLGVAALMFGRGGASSMTGEQDPIAIEGISFAIPIAFAQKVMAEFRQHGQVRRPYVGLRLVAVNRDVVDDLIRDSEFFVPEWLANASRKEAVGLLVHMVEKDSPGEAATLQRGDVILSVDGNTVRTTNDFMSAIAFKFDNAKVDLEVRRASTGKVDRVQASPEVFPEGDAENTG